MADATDNYIPRMRERYDSVIKQEMQEKFSYDNPMRLPKLTKIVVNMGVGEAVADSKKINSAVADMTIIAGQKPWIAVSRKAVANFKLREDMPIGCKVTLRRTRMYEFLDRLINIALPRVRDFRGLSVKSFDGNGNFSLGLKEQIVFPEVNYDEIDTIRGMDITIVTTATTDSEAKALLEGFDFPFEKNE